MVCLLLADLGAAAPQLIVGQVDVLTDQRRQVLQQRLLQYAERDYGADAELRARPTQALIYASARHCPLFLIDIAPDFVQSSV
jgi:hypothetical protein